MPIYHGPTYPPSHRHSCCLLSASLPVCLSACLPVCLSACLPACWFAAGLRACVLRVLLPASASSTCNCLPTCCSCQPTRLPTDLLPPSGRPTDLPAYTNSPPVASSTYTPTNTCLYLLACLPGCLPTYLPTCVGTSARTYIHQPSHANANFLRTSVLTCTDIPTYMRTYT